MCFAYSRETYNNLTSWLTDARTLASPNIVIILLGNKKDLDADREVTFLEASRFAQENGMLYCILGVVSVEHLLNTCEGVLHTVLLESIPMLFFNKDERHFITASIH